MAVTAPTNGQHAAALSVPGIHRCDAFRVEDRTKKALTQAFTEDLQKSQAPAHAVLHEILTDKKNGKPRYKLSLLLHKLECKGGSADVGNAYCVMIKGSTDFQLRKLGEERGFPRGFPLVWFPDENHIESFGFYPKFDNDTSLQAIGGSASREKLFQTSFKLQFFRKWSGFLSMVVAFKLSRKGKTTTSGSAPPKTALVATQFSQPTVPESGATRSQQRK